MGVNQFLSGGKRKPLEIQNNVVQINVRSNNCHKRIESLTIDFDEGLEQLKSLSLAWKNKTKVSVSQLEKISLGQQQKYWKGRAFSMS